MNHCSYEWKPVLDLYTCTYNIYISVSQTAGSESIIYSV